MLSRFLIFAGILFSIPLTLLTMFPCRFMLVIGIGNCGSGVVIGGLTFYIAHRFMPDRWWIYLIASVISAVASGVAYGHICNAFMEPPVHDGTALMEAIVILFTTPITALVGAFFGSGLWRWSRKSGWIS